MTKYLIYAAAFIVIVISYMYHNNMLNQYINTAPTTYDSIDASAVLCCCNTRGGMCCSETDFCSGHPIGCACTN